MSDKQIRFLIIIPCLNEENYISSLVKMLLKFNVDKDFKLVIVDGGSSDKTPVLGTALAEKYKRVEYLHNPLRLQSAAVNLAVKKYGAEFDYLIRIDAHAEYPSDFCEVLLSEAEKMNADSVVVPMNTIGRNGFQVAVAAVQNSKLGNGGSSHRIIDGKGKWVDHGHHALMRIKPYNEVDGYDEAFSHNEDAELDYRLHAAGYKIWLTGKTSIDYYPRSNPVALFKQYFKFGQGRIQNILKHKMKPRLRQLIPVSIVPAVALLLFVSVSRVFALPVLFWVIACLSYGALLVCKKKQLVILLSGIAAIVMHFAWSLGFYYGFFRKK